MLKRSCKFIIIVIIVIIISILPIVINYILLIPSFTKIVGDNVSWLSFWGSYLSSIISACVAFIILYIQRRDNKFENRKIRSHNELQNKSNRQLQYNSLIFQQEKFHYEELCRACIEYIDSFRLDELLNNTLSFIKINNADLSNLEGIESYLLLLDSHTRKFEKANYLLTILVNREILEGKHFHLKRQNFNIKLQTLFKDIRVLIGCSISENIEEMRNFINKEATDISPNSQKLINNYIAKDFFNPISFTSEVIAPLIRSEQHLYQELQELTYKYIQSEKHRIDKIICLNENK